MGSRGLLWALGTVKLREPSLTALFRTEASLVDEEKTDILNQLKCFKPRNTIFEIGNTSKNKEKIDIMSEKRKKHSEVIERNLVKLEKNIAKDSEESEMKENVANIEKVSEEDIENTFDKIVKESKNRKDHKGNKGRSKERREKKEAKPLKDDANYIPYQPSDHQTEAGYSLQSGFSAQVHTKYFLYDCYIFLRPGSRRRAGLHGR